MVDCLEMQRCYLFMNSKDELNRETCLDGSGESRRHGVVRRERAEAPAVLRLLTERQALPCSPELCGVGGKGLSVYNSMDSKR